MFWVWKQMAEWREKGRCSLRLLIRHRSRVGCGTLEAAGSKENNSWLLTLTSVLRHDLHGVGETNRYCPCPSSPSRLRAPPAHELQRQAAAHAAAAALLHRCAQWLCRRCLCRACSTFAVAAMYGCWVGTLVGWAKPLLQTCSSVLRVTTCTLSTSLQAPTTWRLTWTCTTTRSLRARPSMVSNADGIAATRCVL